MQVIGQNLQFLRLLENEATVSVAFVGKLFASDIKCNCACVPRCRLVLYLGFCSPGLFIVKDGKKASVG